MTKHISEQTIALLTIIIILSVTILVMAAIWPAGNPDGTLTYKGWVIYPPSNSTTAWTATRNGRQPLSNNALLNILDAIDGGT